MYSSWLPWDFARTHSDFIESDKIGVYSMLCTDSYIEKLLTRKMKKNIRSLGELSFINGNELTPDWIENNLLTTDMFFSGSSFVVISAEEVPAASKKILVEQEIDFSNRYFVMLFSKDVQFFSEIKDKLSGIHYKIDQPRFWENGKLFNFLCDEMRIFMPYDVKNYILESVPSTAQDYTVALKTIGTHFQASKVKINLGDVKKLIGQTRLDQFLLASLISSKDKVAFYKNLIVIEPSFVEFQSLFNFLQGHFQKLSDTSYISKKKRPTKYDSQILSHSKMWTSGELKVEAREAAKLEIMAKTKSPDLLNTLKRNYLSLLTESKN